MKNKIPKSYLNIFKVILLIIFYQSFILSQQLSWRCIDKKFQEVIIEPYVDLLLQDYPEIDGNQLPSEDDDLIIYLKGKTVTEILAVDQNGVADPLDMKIYDRLDKEIKDRLLKRKYDWDHINPDGIAFRTLGRNAYEFSNHKTVRDHSWWARNLLTANPFTFNNSFILRPEPGLYSIMFKQGDEEIGYPAILSRNSRVFISTEPTQVFLNLPWEPRNISYGEVHPLESVFGGGVSFDIDKLGGMVSYNSIEKLNYSDAFDPDHIVYNDWAGLLYWTRSFKFKTDTIGENSKDFKRRKPWVPKGTQRVKFGLSYSKLVYGHIDSTNNFTSLEVSDFGTSFSLLFNWTYVSEQGRFDGSYNYYNKLTAYFQANIGEKFRLNVGFLRSLNSSLAVGLNIGWAESMTYLEGQNNEYVWEPGLVISPNFTLRF